MFWLMWSNLSVYASAFEFSDETRGPVVMARPGGYAELGDELIVTVGVSPSSPNALAMEVSVQNVINTWSQVNSSSKWFYKWFAIRCIYDNTYS